MSIINTVLIVVLASVGLPAFAYNNTNINADISDDTALQNLPDQNDQSGFAMQPEQMQGTQPLPLAPAGTYPTGAYPAEAGIPNDNSLSGADQGDLAGFPPPSVEMQGDVPLPLDSTGTYPAGMQPGQPIPPPGTPAQAGVPNAVAPLQVHIETNFTGTMANDIDLEYQYYYTNVSRIPWKGYVHLQNHSNEQSTQIPRSSDVGSIMLFLRPGGAGSAQCVPIGGQSPQVFNNTSRVTVKGVTDAGGNFNCQLIYN